MPNEFGDKLKRLRLSKNMSLRDLEKESGVSYSFIGSLEKGRFKPSRDSIIKLANALGEDLDHMLIAAGFIPEVGIGKVTSEDTSDEKEFIEWMKDVDDAFFYDFSHSPEEQKKQFLKTMRALWEVEKKRGKD